MNLLQTIKSFLWGNLIVPFMITQTIAQLRASQFVGITQRDFDVLREDSRRAVAAYPNLSDEDLFERHEVWIHESQKVPAHPYGGYNYQATQGKDGVMYLNGLCSVWTIKPQYTKRVSKEEADAFLAERKQREGDERFLRLKEKGPDNSFFGCSGFGSVNLAYNKKMGKITVTFHKSETTTSQTSDGKLVIVDKSVEQPETWTFPFDPYEWRESDTWPHSEVYLNNIKKMLSFQKVYGNIL